MPTIELLKKCYDEYSKKLPLYQKMYDYYNGDTDAQKNYKIIAEKANNKISNNMIRKFIKQEVGYVLGNPLTYISKSGNEKIIEAINSNLGHWSEKHNQNLLKRSIIYGNVMELYFLKNNLFNAMLLSPKECYVYENENGEIEFAMRFFSKKFDQTLYCDVYTATEVWHYNVSKKFLQIGEPDRHGFTSVPISQCPIAEERELDTLFKDLKGLQDAYETNLSDISNEISDFRNAILKIVGGKLKDEDLPRLKEMGILQSDSSTTSIDWLIKQINDSFIQNTLKTLKEDMYEISGHINSNEKLQSNTSSLTLRTKLIELENKCKLNGDALTDCIKNRLRFLFLWLDSLQVKPTGFDYTDIKIKYTPMIPQDDAMMAQIASQLGITELFSKKTMRSQFSFCDNPDEEEKLVEKEGEPNKLGKKLLDGADDIDGQE